MQKKATVNWDERYAQDEYVFGTEPNDFLASVADKIKKNARVLSLCDGEGRNGTFLAEKGFQVVSLDGSKVGLEKAKKLAKSKKVKIETIVANLEEYKIKSRHWDAIALFFGHFPSDLRKKVLQSIPKGLKKNGVFIMECFSPEQATRDTGGPSDVDRLYDLKETKKLLAGLEFEIAQEKLREVSAGDSHKGEAAVVQIVAWKR